MITSNLMFLTFTLIYLVSYFWKKRKFYYHASKIPGPFSLPIIGTIYIIMNTFSKDLLTMLESLCEKHPQVFKIWIGHHLFFINSKPEEVEIFLNTCLEKSPVFYDTFSKIIKNNLLTSPVDIWRFRRRIINYSFKLRIIHSFHDTFVKYAKKYVADLSNKCHEEITDLLSTIWKYNFESSYETLGGLDPSTIQFDPVTAMSTIVRSEQIILERAQKFWLLNPVIWRFSNLYKEAESLKSYGENQTHKAIQMKMQLMKTTAENDDCATGFLQNLINVHKSKNLLTEIDIVDESNFMYGASSETTSVTLNNVMLILALYPKLQEKIYEEITAVLKNSEDFSLEDIKSLDYLERTIKETLRLFPTAPFIARYIDKDIKMGRYTFPAGSNVIIPIFHIHRSPDLWPEPLKFDPDRFLPEEIAKRHHCAFIPFSYGPRNCIGSIYGMMVLKTTLAYVIKNFTIDELNYENLEDVEKEYHFLLKFKGYRFKLEKRKNL